MRDTSRPVPFLASARAVFGLSLEGMLWSRRSLVLGAFLAIPVLIAIAQAGGHDPLPIALSVTLAASFAFTMPVSTPPNAIAYGTGLIRIQSMIRFGFVLNLLSYLVLLACGALLLPILGLGG